MFGVIATSAGGLIGMIMRYISAGNGRGNLYGLAAVCAACYPSFFFARLYWPIAPMTNLIIRVTTALVVGYSYDDAHLTVFVARVGYWCGLAPLCTSHLIDPDVSIFSHFPPSTTIRPYQRRTLAITSAELGSIYCSVLSYANSHG
ncbi:hypothetical protein C8R48DRAFT_781247 [Suillus tomentosus]|nr:hypothetical protein C8R48DRAFT_781247 [Suillus tomentosus]